MASIVVAGDTSGTVTLTAPLVAGTTTLTLPTANGTVLTNASSIARSQMPSGSVIQTVQYTTNGLGTYSTNDWAEMFNGTITPTSASNRIFIMYQLGVGFSSNQPSSARIRRDSTVVGSNTSSGGSARLANMSSGMFSGYSDFDRVHSIQGHFLDSPNTTATILYRIEVSPRTDSGNLSWRLGAPWNNPNDGYVHRVLNILTLMEIAG